MMIAEGFTCQRYGFNVGADKFSLLTIENGKTSIMRLSEWTLISQSQKSHSDRLLDLVAEAGAGAIGYPVTLGSCIAGFALYSVFILRERITIASVSSFLLCLSGMIAMSIQ